MTTEFELDCANCGSSLTRREVAGESLGFGSVGEVAVAECPDCGGRYYPDDALRRLKR